MLGINAPRLDMLPLDSLLRYQIPFLFSMSLPLVRLGALSEADGSASYSWQGFDVLGAINGPIEPQRRDELPEEAFLEVHVRPVNGVGG